MPRRPLPVEQRSATLWFLLASAGLLLVTVWAIHDETETRRPWKAIQREFYREERAAVEKALDQAGKKLGQEPVRERLAGIDAELSAARERLAGPGYRDALAEVEKYEALYNRVQQDLAFLRSERDEAFYQWKHSLHRGRESDEWRTRFEELTGKVSAREARLEDLAKSRARARERVEEFTEPVAKLVAGRQKITAESDRLLRRLDNLALKRPGIEQAVIPGLDAVDRCMTCHLAIDREGFDGPEWKEPFRTHPEREVLLGKVHPPGRFGCTVCHRGQGPQLKGIGGRPFDHGRGDPYWERPMFDKPFAESSCAGCHPDEWHIDSAPTVNRGKQLFYDLACYACHALEGYEEARRIGPSLAGLKGKVDEDWLVAWLKDPRALRPRTRMPNNWDEPVGVELDPAFPDNEVAAVAAFLFSASTESAPSPPAAGDPGFDRGKRLFIERGCVGCHRPITVLLPAVSDDSIHDDYGPDLSYLGGKVGAAWIESYIADPRALYPETRMPDAKIEVPDGKNIAAFLADHQRESPFPPAPKLGDQVLAERGRGLAALYGCYGCHEIKGFENAMDVGPELNGFGDKEPDLLSFGDTITDHSAQTWERWTAIKLSTPRAFRTERELLVMPVNVLGPEDVLALSVYLKSLRSFEVGPEYLRRLSSPESSRETGERLVKEYNCFGCHLQEGKGGEVRKVLGDPGLFPPDLTGEGTKVQPAWLYQFLKQPTVLRPWLSMRMPAFPFTDAEAEALVGYFMSLSEEGGVFVEVPAEMGPALLAEAAEVFDTLKCLSCHQLTLGPDQKLSDLAPDMGLTRYRLRPRWMEDFIIDPQWLMPETKMPSFFPLEDDEDPGSIMTPLTDWLGGDPWAQIKAITDYLYVMESLNTGVVDDPPR